jgi:hypothetical protein
MGNIENRLQMLIMNARELDRLNVRAPSMCAHPANNIGRRHRARLTGDLTPIPEERIAHGEPHVD